MSRLGRLWEWLDALHQAKLLTGDETIALEDKIECMRFCDRDPSSDSVKIHYCPHIQRERRAKQGRGCKRSSSSLTVAHQQGRKQMKRQLSHRGAGVSATTTVPVDKNMLALSRMSWQRAN